MRLNKSIRVAHVLNNLGDGGAEAFVFDFFRFGIEGSEGDFFIVSLVSPGDNNTHASRARIVNSPQIRLFEIFASGLRGLRDYRAWLKKYNIEVVHAHNLRAIVYTIFAKLLGSKVKIVFTQHIDFLKRPLLHKFFAKWFVDEYVAICDKAYFDMKAHLGKKVSITKIYNGVPEFPLIPYCFASPDDSQKIKVVSVARFSEQKAHNVLVEAIETIRKKGWLEKFHFYFVGDGELKPMIKKMISEYGLSDNVTMTGVIYDFRKYLASFDILVLSSDYEGLPIIALEAIRAGVPIVSTSAGGLPELVVEGKNGYLSPVQDSEALAINLCKVVEEGALEALKGNAREMMGVYAIEDCVDRYCQIYNKVLDKKS